MPSVTNVGNIDQLNNGIYRLRSLGADCKKCDEPTNYIVGVLAGNLLSLRYQNH
jgi:hypothetical protein